MSDALVISSLVFFTYFAVYNLLTIALLAMSYGEIAWLVRGRQPRRSGLRPSSHRPRISVLVPAFNEQEVVVTTAGAAGAADGHRRRVLAGRGTCPVPAGRADDGKPRRPEYLLGADRGLQGARCVVQPGTRRRPGGRQGSYLVQPRPQSWSDPERWSKPEGE